MDHYNILGVSSQATASEIKKAYRKLALKYHPDKNKLPDAEEAFKRVSESYTILSDPESRRTFDTKRGGSFQRSASGWDSYYFNQFNMFTTEYYRKFKEAQDMRHEKEREERDRHAREWKEQMEFKEREKKAREQRAKEKRQWEQQEWERQQEKQRDQERRKEEAIKREIHVQRERLRLAKEKETLLREKERERQQKLQRKREMAARLKEERPEKKRKGFDDIKEEKAAYGHSEPVDSQKTSRKPSGKVDDPIVIDDMESKSRNGIFDVFQEELKEQISSLPQYKMPPVKPRTRRRRNTRAARDSKATPLNNGDKVREEDFKRTEKADDVEFVGENKPQSEPQSKRSRKASNDYENDSHENLSNEEMEDADGVGSHKLGASSTILEIKPPPVPPLKDLGLADMIFEFSKYLEDYNLYSAKIVAYFAERCQADKTLRAKYIQSDEYCRALYLAAHQDDCVKRAWARAQEDHVDAIRSFMKLKRLRGGNQ